MARLGLHHCRRGRRVAAGHHILISPALLLDRSTRGIYSRVKINTRRHPGGATEEEPTHQKPLHFGGHPTCNMADSDPFKARTMKRKNVKGLALSAPPRQATPQPAAPDAGVAGGANHGRDDTLEIGVEFMPKWRAEDLEVLKDLGAGNGGTVSKVRHKELNLVMARKIIHVEAKKEVRKRIVKELQIMHECNSPYIVSFYGAFMNESGDVTMCMEYADVG